MTKRFLYTEYRGMFDDVDETASIALLQEMLELNLLSDNTS